MRKTEHSLAETKMALSVTELENYSREWIYDGEYLQHSPRTLVNRRFIISKLVWFLRQKNLGQCGLSELRQFLAYAGRGHEEPGGRWGNPLMTKPVKARTIHTYHGHLRTLFAWMVAQEFLSVSPMDKIRAPISRSDQIQPFSREQVEALLRAACRSNHARRDETILLFLLDTGVRVSELCALRRRDVDFDEMRCVVLGKGNKHRAIYFGRETRKALIHYTNEEKCEPDDPLFFADRGRRAGEPLTRSGVFQLIQRLGVQAGIQNTRCSPHTFRHTFAVDVLRAGGNVFTLKEFLGHTNLTMVNRYVALAEADVKNQHRQFSPVDQLKKRNRN